jgi:beta-glucanase (GH16 family)
VVALAIVCGAAAGAAGSAAQTCKTLTSVRHGTHRVWRRQVREIHGHRKLVWVHVRVKYRKVVHRTVCATSSASAAPANATTGTPTCGGEVPPAKPGGAAWTCTFDDEFDAATGDANALNTAVWVPQVTAQSGYTTGPLGAEACYENSPQNISVSGGYLHLTARKASLPFLCGGLLLTQYTSGMVSTYHTFSQTYGRFEVRAQLPQTKATGLQETLWLWPLNDTLYGAWPASGEVDFSEFYSQYSNLDIPYIHYDYNTTNASTNTNVVTAYNCVINLSQFNDYAVVWAPGTMTITINGTTCLTDNYVPDGGLTSPAPFNQPFFIALTQALGIGTNAFKPGSTPLPATTLIRYVRAWQ